MKRLLALALCCGLSTAASAQLALEDFEGATFPPPGWTVLDNTTALNGAWDTTVFWNRANSTGGWGEAACIDSDEAGSIDIDTELWSPAFNVPAGGGFLKILTHYNDLSSGGDLADIDISTDGGVTWTNLVAWDSDKLGGEAIDLSAYAGLSVNVRFHYYGANYAWYWLIDNVFTSGAPLVCITTVWTEDFDSGVWPPAGWVVTDNVTSGQTWNLSSVAPYTGNALGTTGDSAVVDSDAHGSGGVQDTELWTLPFDVPAGGGSLQMEMYWRDGFGGTADIDASFDGGLTWSSLAVLTGAGNFGPGTYTLNLDAYAGTTGMIVRFYFTGSYSWWWEIDDVSLVFGATDAASVTWRNDVGPTNPDMYTINGLPVMGEYIQAEVDLTVSGNSLALVFGYVGQLSFAVSGRVALCDFTHPGGEVLQVLPQYGPTATWVFQVPEVCSLVGFELSTQAAGFDIACTVPWTLSNAQDLVLGF